MTYPEYVNSSGLIALATAVVFGACTSAPQSVTGPLAGRDPSPEARLTQQVRVTRDATAGPLHCRPEQVGRLVVDFFAAVNRGHLADIMRAFTKKNGWYSVTEGNPRNGRRHFVAYRPAKLRSYFKARIRQHERMHLVEIDVGYERPGNLGHVAYSLIRSADDLDGYAEEAAGKGAIDCASGRIAVWSMGQIKKPIPGNLCPGTPDPPAVAIACARRGRASPHRPRSRAAVPEGSFGS